MTRVSRFPINTLIRLSHWLSLIFFVLVIMPSCRLDEYKDISIAWTNNQATAIIIPRSLLKNPAGGSAEKYLQVRLKGNTTAMLGQYQTRDSHILFEPVIPLSRGSRYEVFSKNDLIGGVDVPVDSAATSPSVLAVYPTSDTLPENLLKLYFKFSAPMREGEALQHIVLLNANNDTLPDTFLNLQPELWNKERTVLTVWLDPGRIKRDLIPNRKMGNPLQNGQHYTLAVSDMWKNTEGLRLQQTYNRSFYVGPRDSSSPQPKLWKMELPVSGTLDPLKIIPGEPLDYFLLQETISVFDNNNEPVDGLIRVGDKETSFLFSPRKPWRPGRYHFRVASQLEDLAGNNLERLFDRDMLAPPVSREKNRGEREFIIRGK